MINFVFPCNFSGEIDKLIVSLTPNRCRYTWDSNLFSLEVRFFCGLLGTRNFASLRLRYQNLTATVQLLLFHTFSVRTL